MTSREPPLNTAACRLLLDIMPGLETAVVFQEKVSCVLRLGFYAILCTMYYVFCVMYSQQFFPQEKPVKSHIEILSLGDSLFNLTNDLGLFDVGLFN